MIVMYKEGQTFDEMENAFCNLFSMRRSNFNKIL